MSWEVAPHWQCFGLCHALLRGIVVSLNTWKDQYKQMHLLCLLLNIDFFCESEYLVLVMHIHKSQQTIDTTNKQGKRQPTQNEVHHRIRWNSVEQLHLRCRHECYWPTPLQQVHLCYPTGKCGLWDLMMGTGRKKWSYFWYEQFDGGIHNLDWLQWPSFSRGEGFCS